ncbi:TasA family protein [Nocardioides sp. zg-DK7169]|uniref:TasA family protein n=1 Tax=Nocardioides sp. zg-DK7169 TaxID=2736600 RepID=UPI00155439B0|nr:TasA family protein [Nocardioides sp. zg-DK7169]NPC96633.1 hypothetical protein [Nocardioides sp. zg-DK7169]
MRKITRPARRATATKVVASVALLAGAASVAGLGTFGAFTDTTTADQDVATGTVRLGALDSSISEQVTGLVPGDWIERPVTLTRAQDSETFGSLKLTTTVTDIKGGMGAAVDGPQLAVDACSVAWVPKSEGSKELTCPAGPESVVTARPVLGSFSLNDVVPALNEEAAVAHLRVTLKLPATAGEEFKNASAKVRFTFDAVQRNGQAA